MNKNQTIYYFGQSLGQINKLRNLCGVADQNLSELERFLAVKLVLRGRAITILSTDKEKRRLAYLFFSQLEAQEQQHEGNYSPDQRQWQSLYEQVSAQKSSSHSKMFECQNVVEDQLLDVDKGDDHKRTMIADAPILINDKGKAIYARTLGQKRYIQSLLNAMITVCLGPAGTGKTYLSIVAACRLLMTSKKHDKLILTRPVVEAGESLGYLPGDVQQKIDPYLRPLSDALVDCLGVARLQKFTQEGRIELLPLAYMRGRTLDNAVVILDESQNCTREQLKMFFTRIGYGTSFYVNGDITQIDIQKEKSGLEKVVTQIEKLPEVHVHRLQSDDVVRHPLVKKLLLVL